MGGGGGGGEGLFTRYEMPSNSFIHIGLFTPHNYFLTVLCYSIIIKRRVLFRCTCR